MNTGTPAKGNPAESEKDAIAAERQIKGRRREEALIRGDFAELPALASRGRRAAIGAAR
jgi:hypothetical protein